MHTIKVSHVAKSFGETQAVADVSFDVERGEIFGLLGPNGAGKTTTIRMMLDLFKPDRGTVSILGGPMSEEKTERIGYMPEERGLYQDAPLERCLLYLASLKGLSPAEARQRLDALLERFDLAAHKSKKVEELSKGMQQKAQIINTILHRPELVIIDEPFTALDPINTQLVKGLMYELRQQGATILMSTHQMHQVEELRFHSDQPAERPAPRYCPSGCTDLGRRHRALTGWQPPTPRRRADLWHHHAALDQHRLPRPARNEFELPDAGSG